VWAPLIGFAGVMVAAMVGLLGVLRTSRPSSHLADVQGLATLVDQLQEERDRLQRLLDECLRKEQP